MVRKLTVLQMLPALDGGGVERGTLEVGKALVDAGHRSLVMSAGGRMVAELEADGSEHFAWSVHRKSLWTLRLVRPLRRFLREQRVDILHARSRVPAWVAWLAWRSMDPATRPRFVTTVHGLYSVNAYSRVMTRGERVIAVSETVRDYVLSNYPDTDPGVIRVIPRGVDPAAFPYGYRPDPDWQVGFFRDFPSAANKHLLTLPGRLTRLKGHHDFIALIARLKGDGLPVHGLLVGGEDPRRRAYVSELRAAIADAGLDDDISFMGHRTDVREIMAVSDILLSLSTRPESFGRTVVEALSLGRPVVGYAHGGVGEVLAQVYPAGRVELGDQVALAEQVRRILTNAPQVSREHPYHLATMLASTLGVYREMAVC